MDNPPNNTNYAFRFGLKPVKKLTQAIEALCDNDFNPTGRGRIVVKSTDTQRHFSITAHSASNVFGVLVLDGPELENLKCGTPILGNKFVDLNHIRENLVGHDEDSVTIFQTQGFDHITFIFGKDPAQQFTAELYENNDQTPEGKVQKAPSFSLFCGTALPSRDMPLLTSQMLRNGIQQVTIGIMKDEISILIGNGPIMTYNYENMYPNFTSGVMYPWQRHKATFSWTYPQMLLRAARLCPYYSVHFVTEPAIRVFFRFTLPQLGKLCFMKEATRIITIDQRQRLHGHLF